MLDSSSPLLEGQNPTNSSAQEIHVDSAKTSRSKVSWTWSSIPSILINSTILFALLYGLGISFAIIKSTLMPKDEYCLHSVSTSYNYLTFAGEGYGSFYGPTCLNPLRITSTYASGKTFCTNRQIDAGFKKIRADCEQNEFEFPDWQSIVANITDEEISSMRIVEFGEVPAIKNLTEPVRLSRPFFRRIEKTLTTWEYEMNWHHRSGSALYGFWGLILCVAALVHLLKLIYPSFGSAHVNPSKSTSFLNSSWLWIRTNLIISPTFGSHHQRLLLWCTIPTRMETVVVALFYLFTTYLAVSHYRLISNNIYWDDRAHQLWRYVADRTGIMSYATLPLIWIFAGRNNVFMWATGLSYQSFNIYHRHIARAGTILAIIHSVVYTWLFIEFEGFNDFKKELTQLWLVLGVVATTTMSLLLLFSVSWLRIKFYEIFLILHIALSVVTLVGCFLHTSIFDARYDGYLWPIVVVWVLDRGLRLLRLILCNLNVRFSRNMIQRTHTVASYSKDSDVIRIDISTDLFLSRPAAGQFYYIYQPSTWQGYENHPFTLGAWSSGEIMSDDVGNPLLLQSVTYDDLAEDTEDMVKSQHSSRKGHTLTFWVRPYDGWTKRLRDECLNSPNHVIRPTMLLEGPYGHHCPIASFDSVLLIAGGTGIASAVPYILEHISLSKFAKTDTKHMHLLWTARQSDFIREVLNRELRSASQRDDFSADLFYTRHASRQKNGEDEEGNGDIEEEEPDMQFGRPDIAAAIAKAATKAEMMGTRVAVLVCGPPAMADEARVAVHRSLKRGCHAVEYFEESFGW